MRRWILFCAAFVAVATLGVALCLPPAPVREFEAAVETLERAGEPVRLSARPSHDGGAAVLYREAISAPGTGGLPHVETVRPLGLWVRWYGSEARWWQQWLALRRGLLGNEGAMERCRRAARSPTGGFVTALPSSTWERLWLTTHYFPKSAPCVSEPLYDELYSIRSLAHLLALDALDGRTASLEALLAMGRSLGREPFGAYLRAGAYVQRTASAVALRLLSEGRGPTGDVRSWSDSFRLAADEFDLVPAIRNYRAAVLEVVDAIRTGRLPLPEEDPSWLLENVARAREARICSEALVLLRAIEEVFDVIDRPLWEADARLRYVDTEESILLDDLDWIVPDLCLEVAEARTARELASAAFAVLAHHRETGRWPSEFETAPIDHRTGRPARLEVRGEEAWIVLPRVGEWRVRSR